MTNPIIVTDNMTDVDTSVGLVVDQQANTSTSSNTSRYPCGTCDNTVKWADKGTECETCGQWYHAHCQSIGTQSYVELDDSQVHWHCIICGNNNYSSIAFDLHDLENVEPPYCEFKPYHSSTPSKPKNPQRKSRPLRLLNINFRSATGKRAEIINLIDSTRPDIILGCESHLDKDIADSEFLPDNFLAHRADRNRHGGGVLIAMEKQLYAQSTRVHELETNCEIVWVKIPTEDNRHLLLSSYYRPDEGDAASFHQFETSVRRACSKENACIVIGGDLNFPDWDWETMTLKPSPSYPNLHRELLELLHDNALEQMVKQPTQTFKNKPGEIIGLSFYRKILLNDVCCSTTVSSSSS